MGLFELPFSGTWFLVPTGVLLLLLSCAIVWRRRLISILAAGSLLVAVVLVVLIAVPMNRKPSHHILLQWATSSGVADESHRFEIRGVESPGILISFSNRHLHESRSKHWPYGDQFVLWIITDGP